MNCIDAIEGTAKALLGQFLDVSTEYRLDESEYIRNVKAVIDGVTLFVKDNPEICETPDLIRGVLYDFAKLQWLAWLEKTVDPDQETGAKSDVEYQSYCYDYVYAHGNYPVDRRVNLISRRAKNFTGGIGFFAERRYRANLDGHCVISRRRIPMRLPPFGLARLTVLKPISRRLSERILDFPSFPATNQS
jgi:hypothetical protein